LSFPKKQESISPLLDAFIPPPFRVFSPVDDGAKGGREGFEESSS